MPKGQELLPGEPSDLLQMRARTPASQGLAAPHARIGGRDASPIEGDPDCRYGPHTVMSRARRSGSLNPPRLSSKNTNENRKGATRLPIPPPANAGRMQAPCLPPMSAARATALKEQANNRRRQR